MKKFLINLILFLTVCGGVMGQSADYLQKAAVQFYRQGVEAYAEGDTTSFLDNFLIAAKLRPGNPSIMENLATAYAVNSKPNDAMDVLEELLLINASDEVLNKPEFASLRLYPRFASLEGIVDKLNTPMQKAETILEVDALEYHPESITPGYKDGEYYLGSIRKRKIFKVTKKGKVKELVPDAQNGLAAVTGMKAARNEVMLWACSAPIDQMEDQRTDYDGSGVYKFNLLTGSFIQKFNMPGPKENHLFGDLFIHPKAGILITDSKSPVIFKANRATGKLEKWVRHQDWLSLQGICSDAAGEYVYVADYVLGIYRIKVKDQSVEKMLAPKGFTMKGIDGLYYHEGAQSLVAIQNGVRPMRITRFKVDGYRLTDGEYLEKNHSNFDEPTLGYLEGDELIFIANSPWKYYNDNGDFNPPKGEALKIMRLKL